MLRIGMMLGLMVISAAAFADHTYNSVVAYNAVVPCAAQMVGQQPNAIDISRPATA